MSGGGLPSHWYRDSWLSRLLLPLAWLFCLVAAVRRAMYRAGLLRVDRLPVPVIVVGNITVGGSGKTPLLVWLAQQLRSDGRRVGIVSRGYGGRSPVWPCAVCGDSDPALVGDEPVLIALRTGLPVVVGPDRVAAARKLLADHAVDLILSDDGLQHYRMGRQMEIAVVDTARGLGNGRCLPAGPLREAPSRLDAVDLVVRHGADGQMRLRPDELRQMATGRGEALAVWVGRKVHAVAGIGRPERFFDTLRAAGLEVVEHAFPDHYAFTGSDVVFGDGLPVIMTEKDAVKCRAFAREEHWCLPVSAEVDPSVAEAVRKKLKR